MPVVPQYDGLRTSLQPTPGPRLGAAPGAVAAEQTQQLGKAVQGAASGMERQFLEAQRDADELRVADALNQLATRRIDLQVKATQLQGRNALERPDGKALPDEFGSQLDEAMKDIAGNLGNDNQRQAFALRSTAISQQLRGALAGHMAEQQKAFQRETFGNALKVAADQGALLWRDPAARQQAEGVVNGTLAEMGKVYGWDKATAEAERMAALTPFHVGVMRAMLADGQATAAKDYLEANSASLTLQARAQMLEATKGASMAAEAQTMGAQLAAKFGPTETAAAQREIDGLTVAPELKTAIRAELEHRHAVLQADMDKANAVTMGKLSEMVERGMSPAQIQRTPEFLAARDKGAVLRAIRERQQTMINIQAAAESRDYTRVQRLRAEQEYKGLIASYPYSDPQVLMGLSREKLAGKVLELGPQNTERLLMRWDSLHASADKQREAKIDSDLFNSIADGMGLRPFEKSKSEDQTRMLAVAKDRVEAGIAAWQAANPKREMPRDEKGKLMRTMLADQITTEGRLWGTNTTNVLQVPEKDVARIVVPEQDAQLITDALRRARQDPTYKPSREELGRAYLQRKQRDAAIR